MNYTDKVFQKWLEDMPQEVKDLAAKCPPGTYMIEGFECPCVLIGYGEPGICPDCNIDHGGTVIMQVQNEFKSIIYNVPHDKVTRVEPGMNIPAPANRTLH